MNKRFNVVLVLCLFSFLSPKSFGQYFGEQVLEKSFEQSDFFFTPYKLLPFGLGSFKNSVSGVLNDPLLNLELNPSYLYSDSLHSSYLYIDFRSSKEVKNTADVYPFYGPILYRTEIAVDMIRPYPHFYINTRRELEPVISAAYLFRSTDGVLKDLSLGMTYQMISQDEKYYQIPQDIYRSVIGSNYLGVRVAGAEDIPIIDKYSGTDNIHHSGHFISFFSGYEIDPRLLVGAKLSRVTFNRGGSFGSKNLWESYYSGNSTSLWSNNEARSQNYSHWELTAGVNYAINRLFNAGVSGGYLWGSADQVLTRGDSSYYSYGQIGSTVQNWSVYGGSGRQQQTWRHDGKTSFAGIDLKALVTPSQLLRVHYLYTKQTTDLMLGGAIADTSYGSSRYQWDTTISFGSSMSRLADHRRGTGLTTGRTHRITGSLQWDISPSVRLYLGAQYENRKIETNTSEAILANRFSRWSHSGPYAYNYFDSTAESKTLNWNFRSKLTRFSIPIFFTVRASEAIEILFGLNRSMAEWQVEDVTLAIFKYRVHSNPQGTTTKTNFGERYTQPQERTSDVRTTLLAGLTVSPSQVFNIRFLVVPNFVDRFEGSELQELQWWIGINLFL